MKVDKTTILFRPADWNKDIELLCEFNHDHAAINFPGSKPIDEEFKKTIKRDLAESPDGLLMVEIKGKKEPIGFLSLVIRNDIFKDIEYCDVRYVHLTPEYRGKGIGSIMMKKADIYAKEKGAKELRLGTHADNLPSIKLYEKIGYKTTRVIMTKVINDK